MHYEFEILSQAIKEAGIAILDIQQRGFSVTKKANNDLVTQADLRANEIIKSTIAHYFPQDGCLSEESSDDKTRLQQPRVWIIDPIDGTQEYAAGIPEYAISVALCEQGLPKVGFVYNPYTQEFFHAIQGEGAWLNGSPINCKFSVAGDKFLLLASRSEDKRGEWDRFKVNHNVKIVGSIAYKLALVAAGKADATFSLGPKSEWDIAAGVLLVQEAGGVVSDQYKSSFVFNQPNVLVKGIVGSAGNIAEKVFELINCES